MLTFDRVGRLCLVPTLVFFACGESDDSVCAHDPVDRSGLPTITSMSPESGPAGSAIEIFGERFDLIDESYDVAYGDFSQDCAHAKLEGEVVSSTEIRVRISEDATLSGYIYLVSNGATVSRAPERFELEPTARVAVKNASQFPVIDVSANWEPLLALSERIDVDASREFQISPGGTHLEICVGDQADPFACRSFDAQAQAGTKTEVTVEAFSAAHFLAGEWVGTWEDGGTTDEERLFIDADGYWEIRHERVLVESGSVHGTPWPSYSVEFEFSLRDEDVLSTARVPVRSFYLSSPRAGAPVRFYPAE